MTNIELRIKTAREQWPALRSGRQRVAMLAWVAGMNRLAELVMRC